MIPLLFGSYVAFSAYNSYNQYTQLSQDKPVQCLHTREELEPVKRGKIEQGISLLKREKKINMPMSYSFGEHGKLSVPLYDATVYDGDAKQFYSAFTLNTENNTLENFEIDYTTDSFYVNDADSLANLLASYPIRKNKVRLELPLQYMVYNNHNVFYHTQTRMISYNKNKLIKEIVGKKRLPLTFTALGLAVVSGYSYCTY